MANLIFCAFLVFSLGQAGWIHVTQGSVEAWEHAGPRLMALLAVMMIAEAIGRLTPRLSRVRFTPLAYSAFALAALALLGVLTLAAFQIVTTEGDDLGWHLVALACVVAQASATAPVVLATRRKSIHQR